MEVAIVKYNAGNIRSVVNAVRRLGVEPVLTDDAETLRRADRVIFPGQGEAGTTMRYLREHGLDAVIKSLTQPVLGICIGMQLLCRHSEESDTECLGVFDVPVIQFQSSGSELKVPQMGWNTIEPKENCSLFQALPLSGGQSGIGALLATTGDLSPKRSAEGFGGGPYVYFVHSYYVPLCKDTAAVTEYGIPYSSALHKDNFFATQFHPEKSGSVGEAILKNFINSPSIGGGWGEAPLCN